MSRLLLLLSAVAFSLAVAPAAPIPPPPKTPPLYFPTMVGTKWVYQTEGEKGERVEVLMDVKDKDGAKLVETGCVYDGEVKYDRTVSVTEKGLCVIALSNLTVDEPFWELKLPHKAGNKWEYVFPIPSFLTWKGTAVADGPEVVEVPAGKCEAIRVTIAPNHEESQLRFITWYAPRVGKIKEIVKWKAKDRVEVLKSFTPGKD